MPPVEVELLFLDDELFLDELFLADADAVELFLADAVEFFLDACLDELFLADAAEADAYALVCDSGSWDKLTSDAESKL